MEPVYYKDGVQSPGLKRLQAVQMEILGEVVEFCERNGITTFLVAGSALGAARHGKMIPWDDDIDLGMMREEYDRFIALWPKRSDRRLLLQCSASESDYPHDSAKILMRDTYVYSSEFEGTGFRDGIFVDIFPFDHRLKSRALTAVQAAILRTLNLILMSYSQNVVSLTTSAWGRFARSIALRLREFFPLRRLTSLRAKVSAANPFSKSDAIVCYEMYGFSRHRNTIIDRAYILPPRLADFGGKRVPVPADIETYLRKLFGDFRVLPPEEKRVPHHISEVEFAD